MIVGHGVHESPFTIFCYLRDSHDSEWLQHCDRNGYVEHTGVSFRPAVDRRELTGTGSLSLPRRAQNRLVAHIQRT
jgi:hypothetical protein